jgi:hypothetical protein
VSFPIIPVCIAGGCFAGGVIAGRWINSGVANTLALQTVQHGTNLFSYLSIRLTGGNPKFGSAPFGSTINEGDTDGKFFVASDNEFLYEKPENLIYLWFIPRLHAFVSGSHTFQFFCCFNPKETEEEKAKKAPLPPLIRTISSTIQNIVAAIGGIATLCVAPICKFRFTADEMEERFYIDDLYDFHDKYLSYYTKEKVEAWRMGVWGALIVGLNSNWFKRIAQYPCKTLGGLIELTIGCALLAPIIYFTLHSSYHYLFFVAPLGGGLALALI